MKVLSQVELNVMHRLYVAPTEELQRFCLAYLGAPVYDFVTKTKYGHADLCRYLRHHIHLVSDRDLEEFLDEISG